MYNILNLKMMKKNNVIIKKVAICVIAVLMISVTAKAQEKGDLAVGVNVALGSGNSYTNFGLGAKLQYNVIDPVRVEAAFTYFLPKDMLNMWDLGFNGHYLIQLNEKITLYPLAGVAVLGSKIDLGPLAALMDDDDTSLSSSDFGVNFGGGIDLKLSEQLFFNVQLKYTIAGDWGRVIPSVGVTYKF
jgi:outer membrane protein X